MSNSTGRDLIRKLSFNQSPSISILFVVSAGLVALAAYFWAVVSKLQFPITSGLAETATFLPVVNFAAMSYLTNGPRNPQNGRPEWTVKTGIISILLIIIDTVVMTQSINNMSKSAIACPLERTWHAWYRAKDATHIKAVQDALHCCGFNTVKDGAWPFPRKGIEADTCSIQNKTAQPCYAPWSEKHQLSATIFMVVAAVTLVSKGLIFVAYRMNSRQQPPAQGNRRLIAERASGGSRDEGSSRAIEGLRIRPDERARGDEDDDIESVINENSRLLNNGDGVHYKTPGQLESGERPILTVMDDSVWDNEDGRGNQR